MGGAILEERVTQLREAAWLVSCMSLSWADAWRPALSVYLQARNLRRAAGFAAEVLQREELQILNDAVSFYDRVVGRSLEVGVHPEPEQPASAPAVVLEAQGSSWSLRLHGQDVQLTFNHGPWRSRSASTDEWFASEGTLLVGRFQHWALESLPNKFRETMLHISLTLEESCHAAENAKRVHLHTQITFRQKIDRTSAVDLVFEGVRPHVATGSTLEPSQSPVQSHLCVLFALVGTDADHVCAAAS